MDFFRSIGGEILQVCAAENLCSHDLITHMIRSFLILMMTTKKLPEFKAIIEARQEFQVDYVYYEILCKQSSRIAKCADHVVIQNIKRCLEAIRLINMVLRRIYTMKSESFSIHQIEHIELLQQLWYNMKIAPSNSSNSPTSSKSAVPDLMNQSPVVSSSRPSVASSSSSGAQSNYIARQVNALVNVEGGDWMELGFQGADPSTDFRGMGILGLSQLLYFSQYKGSTAKIILADFSSKPTTGSAEGCYFPFAIIGINITRFLLELIDEKRIYNILIDNLAHTVGANLDTYQILPADDTICIEFGMNIVHDVYCHIFEEFYLQYVIIRPQTIMYFNMIFDTVKESMRKKYPPIIKN